MRQLRKSLQRTLLNKTEKFGGEKGKLLTTMGPGKGVAALSGEAVARNHLSAFPGARGKRRDWSTPKKCEGAYATQREAESGRPRRRKASEPLDI